MEEKIVIDASCAVCRRKKWMDGWWAISWLGFHHRLPHHLIFFISFSSSSLLSFESCWGGGESLDCDVFSAFESSANLAVFFLLSVNPISRGYGKKERIKETNKLSTQTYTQLPAPFSIVCVSRGSTCHLVEKFSSISDVLYIYYICRHN